MMAFETTEAFARRLDEEDPLAKYRSEFFIPKDANGNDVSYFTGNSLGLQPKRARQYVDEALNSWRLLAVEGHVSGPSPWLPYHEFLTNMTANVVGALPTEVVVMNTLTVNLHLMLTSFYRPTAERHAIAIEAGAFSSDRYAAVSHIELQGLEPGKSLIEMPPSDLLSTLDKCGKSIALVLLGNVNYLTGQAFPIAEITRLAKKHGFYVGLDLAHGAGNLLLSLHDWNVDFACWCSYKYLNGGPGAIGGCFVHERHAHFRGPRLSGWWGSNKSTRFEMKPQFDPISGAEGWQLSNPPIFSMAALRGALELFEEAGMKALWQKSITLTHYLETWLRECGNAFEMLTPHAPDERGCQLSVRTRSDPNRLLKHLKEDGIVCDLREPDTLRMAPVPLYTRFHDVYRLGRRLCDYVAV